MTRKSFYIETLESLSGTDAHQNKELLVSNPIARRYMNYAVIYEDFRTIIELNKTIEDLLTGKYIFFKQPKLNERIKKYKAYQDLEYDVTVYNTLLMQSLFTTAIVTYVKWFTKSTGGNRTKLEASVVYKSNGKAILQTHALALEYRHSFLAHGGTEDLEYSFPLFMPALEYDQARVFPISIKVRVPLLREIRRFDKLFKKAEIHVLGKMEEIKPKVIEILEKEHAKKVETYKIRKRNNT